MFIEDAGDGRLVQTGDSLAREHHDIECRQLLLPQAKALPDQALESVALAGQFNVFFCDDQTQSGSSEVVAAGDNEQLRTSGFYLGIGKDP